MIGRRRKEKHVPKNRIYDSRTLEQVLDEMAIKWALKAEELERKNKQIAFKH